MPSSQKADEAILHDGHRVREVLVADLQDRTRELPKDSGVVLVQEV
jgi:hypothetical protein